VLADRARSECARSMRAVGIIPATPYEEVNPRDIFGMMNLGAI